MELLSFGDRPCPLIFGHRGVPLAFQENTLAGFRAAIALGLDGVELDVFLTKDDRLVVFHDEDTARLTGVARKITAMTWADIQTLRIQPTITVGNRVRHYRQAEPIPLLQEVLAIAKQHQASNHPLQINLEIKPRRSPLRQRATVQAVLALLEAWQMNDQVFLSSFDPWAILWLRQCRATPPYGFILSPSTPKFYQSAVLARLLQSRFVSFHLDLCDPSTLAQARNHYGAIAVWTIFSRHAASHEREFSMIRDFATQGVGHFITDDPVRLREFLTRP